MQETSDTQDLFTYEETARELDRSRSRIGRAASQGILHPIDRPGTRLKYIHRDEIEWFRDKTLTRANAILYRDAKGQHKAEPPESWAGRIKEFFTEEEMAARLILSTLSLALAQKDILRKHAHSEALKLIDTLQYTKDGQAQLGSLAIELAEILTSEKLLPPDRRLLRETLDILLDAGAGEQDPPSAGRLVRDTEELDTYIADQARAKNQAS